MTRLSNEERRSVIERFYARVTEGLPVDEQWTKSMVDLLAPKLPDEPTPAQLDAWIELSEILSDASFVETMRAMSREAWTPSFDAVAHRRASNEAVKAARAAIDRGVSPTSAEAHPVVDAFVGGIAAAAGRAPDAAFRRETGDAFAKHDPRASRVWELSALLSGRPATQSHVEEWKWLATAIVAASGGGRRISAPAT